MIEYDVLLNLPELKWQSDWDGEDVGFIDTNVVGMYTQNRDDGDYSFYIDMETMNVLDFWKEDTE